MTDVTEDTRLDHELAVQELTAAALRGGMALLTGSEPQVAPVLSDVAVALVDDTEVARLDAMKGHTASAVVRALVVPLGIRPDDLIPALRRRAESLPLVLVVENGECLGSRALDALRALLHKAQGGLGVVIGGDPELVELLGEAGIGVDCHRDAAGIADASEHARPDASGDQPQGILQLLPWKHLAAVVGLLLLVVLFWPGEEKAPEPAARSLSLPAPAQPGGDAPAPEPENSGEATRPAQAPADPAPGPAESVREPEPDPAPAATLKPEPEPAPKPEEAARNSKDEAPARLSARPELKGLEAELGYRREDWLLAQSDGKWVLQLTLAANEDRARAVLDRLGRERGAYYRVRREGGPVYIVLSGPYATREEALGARSGLPEPIRAAGPFPRRMATVHEEITADGPSG